MMIISINRRHPDRAHLRRLANHLRYGTPVVLPTETQYALACDATSQSAVHAVRAIKGRQPTAPFSIFLPGIDALKKWRIDCPDHAARLAQAFWPGPITLILPTVNPIFKLLGGDGVSVGVRVTPEPLIAALLDRLQRPLVATSANPSGAVLNAGAENRWLEAQARLGAIIWARPARYLRRPASTIVDCTGKVPRELRPGPISKAEWNATLSKRV